MSQKILKVFIAKMSLNPPLPFVRSEAPEDRRFVTSSRPVSIHQFTVFRFRFRRSRRFNPGVLIASSQLQSCSRGPVVFIWCQSPGCSLCKRIYSLSWAYLERKSQIWPYIYNQRKQSSSTYFENERSGSQLSIWKHLVCNITAIMHNVYVKYIYSGMPL